MREARAAASSIDSAIEAIRVIAKAAQVRHGQREKRKEGASSVDSGEDSKYRVSSKETIRVRVVRKA